jgi:hypothetical protein
MAKYEFFSFFLSFRAVVRYNCYDRVCVCVCLFAHVHFSKRVVKSAEVKRRIRREVLVQPAPTEPQIVTHPLRYDVVMRACVPSLNDRWLLAAGRTASWTGCGERCGDT